MRALDAPPDPVPGWVLKVAGSPDHYKLWRRRQAPHMRSAPDLSAVPMILTVMKQWPAIVVDLGSLAGEPR